MSEEEKPPSAVYESQSLDALKVKDFERALVYSNLAIANAILEVLDVWASPSDDEDEDEEEE